MLIILNLQCKGQIDILYKSIYFPAYFFVVIEEYYITTGQKNDIIYACLSKEAYEYDAKTQKPSDSGRLYARYVH